MKSMRENVFSKVASIHRLDQNHGKNRSTEPSLIQGREDLVVIPRGPQKELIRTKNTLIDNYYNQRDQIYKARDDDDFLYQSKQHIDTGKWRTKHYATGTILDNKLDYLQIVNDEDAGIQDKYINPIPYNRRNPGRVNTRLPLDSNIGGSRLLMDSGNDRMQRTGARQNTHIPNMNMFSDGMHEPITDNQHTKEPRRRRLQMSHQTPYDLYHIPDHEDKQLYYDNGIHSRSKRSQYVDQA